MIITLSETEITKILNEYIELKYNVYVWRKISSQFTTEGEGLDVNHTFTAYCEPHSIHIDEDDGDSRCFHDPNGFG